MNKSLYILICLILSVSFWNLSIVMKFLTQDMILGLYLTWVVSGVFFYNNSKRRKVFNNFKYRKIVYFILLGVFISMFSAYYFWKQSFSTTFIAQREIFSVIFLPVLLFIQPTEKDIVKALKWISICTILVWILVHFNPMYIQMNPEVLEQAELKSEGLATKLLSYVNGIEFVVLYFYFKINDYMKVYSSKAFLEVLLLFLFIILYQNRSMLLGTAPVFFYSLLKFKSRYKTLIIIPLSIILGVVLLYTSDIFTDLINRSQEDLGASDYNRWKSLYYYFYEYSPNWFCYIFGNGFPSGGKSPLGNLMWFNFTNGIYASDLGLIGMWTDFGLIPLIATYSIIVSILRHKYYPLFLKFISLHILFVPTIFGFWSNPGISFFVLLFYFRVYYLEQYKKSVRYAANPIGKLRKERPDNFVYKGRVIQSANYTLEKINK